LGFYFLSKCVFLEAFYQNVLVRSNIPSKIKNNTTQEILVRSNIPSKANTVLLCFAITGMLVLAKALQKLLSDFDYELMKVSMRKAITCWLLLRATPTVWQISLASI
jgi:hypothetical protein